MGGRTVDELEAHTQHAKQLREAMRSRFSRNGEPTPMAVRIEFSPTDTPFGYPFAGGASGGGNEPAPEATSREE
jgi:hypothetical protein